MGKLIKFLEVTLKYSRKNVVGEKDENDWQNVGNLLKLDERCVGAVLVYFHE